MHIVIIIGRFYPYWGGAETRIKRIAETMGARGLKISVLTPRWNREHPLAETIAGINIYRLVHFMPFFHVSAKQWLAKHRKSIDVVHTIRLDKMGPIGVWANRRLGIPHLSDIITNEAEKILVGNRAKPRFWKRILKGTNLLHCLNQKTVLLLQQNKVLNTQIWYQPNAVDINFFTPGNKNRPPITKITVLCCGRIEKQKGSDILIAAWKLLPEEITQKARLVFAGSGKWDELIQHQAAGLSNVIFAGAVEREKILGYYQAAQIYVQPSRFEGMSNAILEAMATGLPIITTKIDGNTDLVEHGCNGLLVSTEDPPQLAKALQELIVNQQLREKMGEQSRRIVEDSFSLEKLFDSYEQTYHALANRSHTK